MNRDEEDTGGEKDTEGYSLITLGIIIIIILGVFILLLNFFPFGGGAEYAMNCYTYDLIAEEQEEWLKSDNITSYEDIPEKERSNLSEETRDRLKKGYSTLFKSTEYRNLSMKQKNAFKRALNESTVVSEEERVTTVVFYENDTYRCERNPTVGA